jgi:hypothetical protein
MGCRGLSHLYSRTATLMLPSRFFDFSLLIYTLLLTTTLLPLHAAEQTTSPTPPANQISITIDGGGTGTTIIPISLHPTTSKAAYSSLTKWAKELSNNGGTVQPEQAYAREQTVVENVNSGLWDESTYHSYQRLVSITGNVDSARLLRDYGIATSINEVKPNSENGQILTAIRRCDVKRFKILVNEPYEIPLLTGKSTYDSTPRYNDFLRYIL